MLLTYSVVALSFAISTHITWIGKAKRIGYKKAGYKEPFFEKLVGFVVWTLLASLCFPLLVIPFLFLSRKTFDKLVNSAYKNAMREKS